MTKYKLVKIRPFDTLKKRADIEGYFNALDAYLISKDPYIVEGDINVVDSLMEIGKQYQVQTQWESMPE